MKPAGRARLEAEGAAELAQFWRELQPLSLADATHEIEARMLDGEPVDIDTLKEMADRSYGPVDGTDLEHELAEEMGVEVETGVEP